MRSITYGCILKTQTKPQHREPLCEEMQEVVMVVMVVVV
jgi:hypothetical protein